MDKMTNKKALMFVKENFTEMPADVAEKIDAMILSLDKKSTSRKPTATQKANEELKSIIVNALTSEPKTISELIAEIPALNGLTTQKVSPLLYQLKAEKKADKTTDGKRTLFFAVA